MDIVNQKIIQAIIEKANKVCPDSLALIGIYGSVATADTHEKSDLDLLILIEDEKGYKLAKVQTADLFPRCAHIESIACLIKI